MIKDLQVGGKKVSIKYYLNSGARPRLRNRDAIEISHFPLYFELVYNKKINRRSSLFYKFQKHLTGTHHKPYYFSDHYISQFSFDDLEKPIQEKKQAFFSKLIGLEKAHIESLLKLTEGWSKETYSLAYFAEIYDLSTQFAFDYIENGVIENKLIPAIEKIIDAQTISPFVYNYDSYKKYLKDDISAKDLFQLLNQLAKISKNENITEIIRPYLNLLEKIEMYLNPDFNFPDQNPTNIQQAITVTSWFSESIFSKLTSFLEIQSEPEKFDFIEILSETNENFEAIISEIEILFKKTK